MKEQKIVSVLYELHRITGFRMSLHDVDFREIAAYPAERLPLCAEIHKLDGEFEKCRAGDEAAFLLAKKTQKTVIYKCRYGLTEVASPLYNFGILTGYLMMGQIIDGEGSVQEVKDKLSQLLKDTPRLSGLIDGLAVVKDGLLDSYVHIMTICAQYLTLSNAISGSKPTVAEAAKRYIHENIEKRLSIRDICAEVGCSKTTLISAFKKEFGITVNSAITKAKLDEAKRLLIAGKMSINEVAQATGFYDQSYFSKVFSAHCGISPSEFKRGGTA
ncbi:MAG: AraC family transcriptional regulator [Clostridia bacterium]|nr:AraC family transcriptional regulator [Clostridia bacterium]